ncbi:tyrosine-type recombinase/integrase [Saccharopolyspora hattusasensis]|uniref:tyrosine-type recombinase/integrase n=1 Tax=Saccharopolyspora hattusasensis TaxID=1128679 RepID=UPI003D98B989
MTSTIASAEPCGVKRHLVIHEHLLERHRVGPVDHLSVEGVLALLPQLPIWPTTVGDRNSRIRGATTILNWLLTGPGAGWQERWVALGADNDLSWIDTLAPEDGRSAVTQRQERVGGLACLLLCRVVLPSYDFLACYQSTRLFDWVRQIMRPDVFAVLEQAATERGFGSHDRSDALRVISKIVLHTGKNVDELTADDVLEVFAWSVHDRPRRKEVPGLHTAWDLLSVIGVTPAEVTLRGALRRGQRTTADLIDAHDIRCRPIRDVLVRYLDERRSALDYNSLSNLAGVLAGSFWADIEKHHPGIDTLHLSDEVARAWKERVRIVTMADGNTRHRKDIHRILMRVRAFYLDIQQWALEDPGWARWAVPSPVRKSDTQGYEKAKRKRQATMHQRVRERLPHLPLLADTAERCRAEVTALLDAANECEPGEVFDHAGARYRRIPWKTADYTPRSRGNLSVGVENLATGETINLTRREDESFWAWAIIEVLRQSGVRLEELLEITHLALVSYKLPDSGEIVPLLQIVPSKSNEERLLLVSPELASVLATIISRLRADNSGTVPLVGRYDAHERVTGPPLPHLFQRALGPRREVISAGTVYKLINTVLAATGLRDATGQPLVYRPHDFRRMFTTAAVTGGLPIHIAARLLGHKSIATTEAYMAVFQEDLIRAYRSFLDKRRATRPPEEYREPTEEEWQEFQQHFHARKVALGECGRPYGSSCQHEHSCIRCPMLRVSPTQRPRLVEIIRNLGDRITEAKMNNWLGEVQGKGKITVCCAPQLGVTGRGVFVCGPC